MHKLHKVEQHIVEQDLYSVWMVLDTLQIIIFDEARLENYTLEQIQLLVVADL